MAKNAVSDGPKAACEQAVSHLLRQLALAGMGEVASEITPANYGTARRAVGLLAKWRTTLLDMVERINKEVEAGMKREFPDIPDGPWSPPDSPASWAKRFGVSWDTLKRRFADGTIRHKKLTAKSYRIHLDDMPSK